MGVSASSYYEWLNRRPSARLVENSAIRDEVVQVFDRARGTYGRRRIARELNKKREKPLSANRIARRMQELNIAGYRPKSFKKTTIGDPLLEDSPNLLKEITVRQIDKAWVSDLTYIATKEGWLYLCTIMDLCSRKIVGWATRTDMTAEIVIKAFDAACAKRKPTDSVIFHSDKGGQYKSKRFRRKLKKKDFMQSMTGKDHCFDNAHAESFFSTLKRDLIRGKIFATRSEAEAAVFEYIEVFYNRFRLHSSLDYQSPDEFEKNIA